MYKRQGYEYKAKLTILKEAARMLNYLTENNLLQYADLEKKVEDVHSSYDRTGKELKGVEARLREVQPLIKNISNYQRLKPVYDAFQQEKDKTGFKAKHEAELVIFEAARSTLPVSYTHLLEKDTIGGFNSMIEKQKKENGEALISTVLFDNVSEVIPVSYTHLDVYKRQVYAGTDDLRQHKCLSI